MNYFHFYGLPIKFNLNEQELKAKYFDLLKTNHPDFFVNDPVKYKESLINASLNNEAYKCLSNFTSRANHILALFGQSLEDKLPTDFLMVMMETNEALDDLRHTPNASGLLELEKEINTVSDGLQTELKQLSLEADSEISFEKMPLIRIKENLLKLKYILRLKETLANIAAVK